jgi:hypothetical protein
MREDRDTTRAGAQRESMSWIMRVSNVPFGNYTSHSYIIKYFIYNIVLIVLKPNLIGDRFGLIIKLLVR